MTTSKLIGALSFAFAALAVPAKADLVFAGGLFNSFPGDIVDRAVALESQFHTGPLTFLGRYVHDPTTGAVTFVPGAISDPLQLSYIPVTPGGGLVSWDFAGTGFQNRFAVTLFFGDDFAFDVAFRVARDEFINSFGSQPLPGSPVDFFGTPSSVPDAGSTALLLATAMAGVGLIRRVAWLRLDAARLFSE